MPIAKEQCKRSIGAYLKTIRLLKIFSDRDTETYK